MDALREAHFTSAERAYLQLFKDIKDLVPQKDVSVFQQPMKTRYDILRTILFRPKKNEHVPNPTFELADTLVFPSGEPLLKKGYTFHQIQYWMLESGAFDFFKLKSVREFSDFLCKNIVAYSSQLRVPEPSPTNIDETVLKDFLRHYQRSIELLLRGPPHADEHGVDPIIAEQWISAQKTPERQRLARLLIQNVVYINHTELLKQIKKCVDKTRKKLIDGPVTFIVGTPDKSNYYVSLLFYHFWNEAGLPLHSVTSHMHSLLPGNLIDIDEMAYSGTQTTNTLRSVYGSLLSKLKSQLDTLNSDQDAYNRIRNFLPLPIVEYIFYKHKIQYCVVRFFCSENGKKELMQMPPKSSYKKHTVKPPFSLIIGRDIPSLTTLVGEEDAFKLSYLFGPGGGTPASTAYFNHKIADLPSTFLYPLAYGVVPTRMLWMEHPKLLNDSYFSESTLSAKEIQMIKNLQGSPEGNTREIELLPFLQHCGPSERKLPTTFNEFVGPELNETSFQIPTGEANAATKQEYRCPYAWYKNIDYESGIYKRVPNTPLPYGPTENNFVGGERSRPKRSKKTHKTKQKRRGQTKKV
jgi:hypothetical protein